MRGALGAQATQRVQADGEAVTHRHILIQESLVPGQQESPLAGLGILDRGEQLVRFAENDKALPARRGGVANLPERPEQHGQPHRDQQHARKK